MKSKVKELKEKTEKVEYFTDEMAKNIFPFQDPYTGTRGSKPITKPLKLKFGKK